MMTFFFRHMIDLVRQGRLYLAQPPLYRITVGSNVHYAQDDAAKEEILSQLPENRKYEVTRFKGLGEMTAQQLKDTTLNPSTRTLLQVSIESQVDADRTFQQLLGKDASERYRVIMEASAEADDLDV